MQFRWKLLNTFHVKSTLVQVVAWRHQATQIYVAISISMSPKGITRQALENCQLMLKDIWRLQIQWLYSIFFLFHKISSTFHVIFFSLKQMNFNVFQEVPESFIHWLWRKHFKCYIYMIAHKSLLNWQRLTHCGRMTPYGDKDPKFLGKCDISSIIITWYGWMDDPPLKPEAAKSVWMADVMCWV